MERYTLKTSMSARRYGVDYERELNPEQLAVVTAPGGPMLVIAGAGSGKTRTVTYRVARLIESGEAPGNILLLTFTNKAAREMLHRVELLIKTDINQVWGGTFHHTGNAILRRHADLIGYGHNYAILDREDSRTLINSCVGELKIDVKQKRFPKGNVLSDIVSLSVNTGYTIEQVVNDRYPFFLPLIAEIERVARHYQTRKKQMNLMDFDDLLLNWRLLLNEQPQIRDSYGGRFRHILVDEYQDTNLIQAEVVDLLAARHRNVMVVGDDAQSIYSFRGANFVNIMEFPRRYPDAVLYRLTTNYRSTPEILTLANHSISFNRRQFPKELSAIKGPGGKPVLVPTSDLFEQAEFVAQRILELRDEGHDLNDIAVLYRSHYHSLELQIEFTRRGIPYEVRSGLKFFEQAHLKDVFAYLKIIYNPMDELSWKRILKLVKNIGTASAERLWQFLSQGGEPLARLGHAGLMEVAPGRARGELKKLIELLTQLNQEPRLSPSQMIELVLTGGYQQYLEETYPNYSSRIEDLRQLSSFAMKYTSLERLLSELALLSDIAAEHPVAGGPEDERVTLSSIHQAKGLEWPVVFIVWLAEGRFPSLKSIEDEEGEEEERRLFYVAATRAKENLYLTYPLFTHEGGRGAYLQKLSRFVQQVPEDCYERWIVERPRTYSV